MRALLRQATISSLPVRSRPYECFLYGTATHSSLQLLDSIHNAAIRLCTEPVSPVDSLYADSGEKPLSLCRDLLLLQYYARTLQPPSPAMYPYVQPRQPLPMKKIPTIATLGLNFNIASLLLGQLICGTAPLMRFAKVLPIAGKTCLNLSSCFADHMAQFHNEQF